MSELTKEWIDGTARKTLQEMASIAFKGLAGERTEFEINEICNLALKGLDAGKADELVKPFENLLDAHKRRAMGFAKPYEEEKIIEEEAEHALSAYRSSQAKGESRGK